MLPVINAEYKNDWGTRLLVNLPTGLPSSKVIENQTAICEALHAFDVDIYWKNGLIIDIYPQVMTQDVPYNAIARHDYKVPIGINRRGEIKFYDFAGSFPHLLIGGISGGGKSVILRSILTSLALGPQPDLYLCDMKGGVELGLYRNLAITKGFATTLSDVQKFAGQAETEMSKRYSIMAANDTQEWEGKRLIFVMDEMADLKTRAGDPESAVKGAIKAILTRISAKGRAAGVILVLCTQRPSADIVDGLIKTNIATSICFRTRDGVQSRVILDHDGASDLPDIPGRCIYQQAKDETLQTYFLPYKKAKKLLVYCERKAVVMNEPGASENPPMDGDFNLD
ncbi:FtsK/SpoIIIE domain-containing protein [Paenibacillus anseongense]|uniref:FtsK/SpoIIIE domain-containing protein n=1 Tax=Paenibacillus anseongense TaxID=2682845 RepID=UPI002DB8B501|nr:FtsK/SpoIIIE domain-containing protein [Paenibacillus anseongense]MEC0266716.1 FtsK/SpoIIIE domain-containing protein [Paenibacillus anseongense]